MQKVPGNIKYRKLVAANKELYARLVLLISSLHDLV